MRNWKSTEDGRRFDFNKATLLGNCSDRNDTRGKSIYRTSSGNLVIQNWTRWQGEKTTFEACTEEEAMSLALQYWTAEEIAETFPSSQDMEEEI